MPNFLTTVRLIRWSTLSAVVAIVVLANVFSRTIRGTAITDTFFIVLGIFLVSSAINVYLVVRHSQ
jgi:hypothetical protein